MKTKKILLPLLVPMMAFLLSGCGMKKDVTPPTIPGLEKTNSTTQKTTPAQKPEPVPDQAGAAAAKQQSTLPALPADDKTALDSEISNIDKELQTTDNLLNENDFSEVQLGL